MPVGFVGALELLDNFKDVWLPSFHILGRVDLARPRSCTEGFNSLGKLEICELKLRMIRMGDFAHSQFFLENKSVNDRQKLEVGFEYGISSRIPTLRKSSNGITESVQHIVHFNAS